MKVLNCREKKKKKKKTNAPTGWQSLQNQLWDTGGWSRSYESQKAPPSIGPFHYFVRNPSTWLWIQVAES